MLAAVKQTGWMLQYASDELKADKEVVLAAIAQDESALVHVADELKADEEITLAAQGSR